MEITISIGKAGRLVVPKTFRDSLGLREGSRLTLEIQGGKLQATPEPDPVRIDVTGRFPVIRGTPPLKRGLIVQALKEERDSRDARTTPRSTRK
jgi:AbrB family looped-hinge helix DNA binding protein